MALVWAIVVAGGSGQRFGQMKQFANANKTRRPGPTHPGLGPLPKR